MKSAIFRMNRCGRSTIPTMLRQVNRSTQLFKNPIEAPKFGRLTAGVSKSHEGEMVNG